MNKKQKNKGFSVLEMLLYVTLFATVIAVISTFFVSMLTSKQKNYAIREVEQQGQFIMENILFELRNAEVINNLNPGNTDNDISINTFLLANDPTIFELVSGDVFMSRGSGSPVKLNNDLVNIDTLSFSNYSRTGAPAIVSVYMTISMKNPGNRPELRYRSSFYGTASLKI